MLPRSERLTSTEFDRAFRHAEVQIVRHPLLHLKFAPRNDGDETVRAAFVVPKKQGKATQRNRVRRRLREHYRLHALRQANALSGFDLIFLTTPETANASPEQLDEALANVLSRAGKRVGKGGSGGPKEPAPAVSPRSQAGEEDVSALVLEPETSKSAVSVSFQSQPVSFLALGAIRFYQRFISPGLPPSCRFHPTCSRYTYEAIERFGVLHGGFLGAYRICRCNPWHPGGFDPVPEESAPGLLFGAGVKKFWARWRRSHKGEAAAG